jgi:hypothetical protein
LDKLRGVRKLRIVQQGCLAEERRMTGGTKAIKVTIIAVGIIASLILPAYPQGMKKGSHAAPSTETRPQVDEKAYKAALDRIPTPKQAYDPWGVARPSEPAKTAK